MSSVSVRFGLGALLALALGQAAPAAEPPVLPMTETEQAHPALPPILSPRERATVVDAILADRLQILFRQLARARHIHRADQRDIGCHPSTSARKFTRLIQLRRSAAS